MSCLPPGNGVRCWRIYDEGRRLTVSTGEVLVGGESDDHVGVLEDVAAGAVAAVRVVVGG